MKLKRKYSLEQVSLAMDIALKCDDPAFVRELIKKANASFGNLKNQHELFLFILDKCGTKIDDNS